MVETIKKQTYFVILLSAVLPLFLFNIISFSQFKSYVHAQSSEQIEYVRDEWLVRYKFEYNRLFNRLDLIMGQKDLIISVPEKSHSASSLKSVITEESGVAEVVFFDDTYTPVNKIDSSGLIEIHDYSSSVRLTLQEIVFPAGRVTSDIQLPDGTSALYIFYKVIDSEHNLGYAAWKLSYDWLQNTLPSSSAYSRNIFNDKYQLIASSGDTPLWSTHITEQTERMLDGFSETEVYSGVLHSFGFVDLGDTAVYGDIVISTSSLNLYFRNILITAIFFLLFTILMAIIFAWNFSGRLLRYGESVLIKNNYTKEMKFFRRMEGNIHLIREDAETIAAMQTRLGYLLNDINVIVEELPDDSDDKKS